MYVSAYPLHAKILYTVESTTMLRDLSSLFQFSAVSDDDFLAGLAAGRSDRLDGFHHVHTIYDATEYDMLAVQPGGFGRAKEELRPVAESWVAMTL